MYPIRQKNYNYNLDVCLLLPLNIKMASTEQVEITCDSQFDSLTSQKTRKRRKTTTPVSFHLSCSMRTGSH